MEHTTPDKNYYLLSFFLVVLGGFIWSTSSIVVRLIENAEIFRWQYLFFRGLGLSVTLIIYQIILFKNNVFKKLYDVGWNGIIGGISLGFSSIFYVFSITQTTIAVTMFMIALCPLFTALLSLIVLKEKIKKVTIISMILSFLGCSILVVSEYSMGSFLGAFYGLLSSLLFAGYTISIRWESGTPKPRTTIIGGFVTALISITYLFFFNTSSILDIPSINIFYSLLNGIIVGVGLILFMFGARYLMAAELVLLSLMEIVGSILWSWLPWIGINENISKATLIGGSLIINSILFRAITLNEKKPFFKLKKKFMD